MPIAKSSFFLVAEAALCVVHRIVLSAIWLSSAVQDPYTPPTGVLGEGSRRKTADQTGRPKVIGS
jgi:hypothetical protein